MVLFHTSGNDTDVSILLVIGTFFATLGAWFGGNLNDHGHTLQWIGMVGTLLMVPFGWLYWSLIHTQVAADGSAGTIAASSLEYNFWLYALFNVAGCFG